MTRSKQDPHLLIEQYKARCNPWTIELWDTADDAYVERKFRRFTDEQEQDDVD